MLLNPGNAVRTPGRLDSVPQATARFRATWPETGTPFTEPLANVESGQTVLTGLPVLFGSPAGTIGSPLVEGFAEAGSGKSWFALLSRVKCVPLLPTYAAAGTQWEGNSFCTQTFH